MASTWDALEQKCKQRGLSDAAIAAFKNNYTQLQQGATGLVPETDIEAVTQLPKLTDLPAPKQDEIKDLLSKTAMLKLNGGLGTSMGLEKAKSLLVVKEGKTFLDLIAEQVKHMRATYGSKVAFTLMDSFSTSADTRAFLQQRHGDLLQEPYIELMQNMSPKVDANTLGPASYPENPDNEWNPPGHGDIYPSLLGSGMLDKMLGAGIKYLFVSNSDNLGATLDLTLLSHFASSGNAFLMEVCERTLADKKGGHLCKRKSDGKLVLREQAMCPDADKGAFEDVSRHKFFNTNNLWLNLEELKGTLASSGGFLPLPLIKNKKTVNPRDSKSAPVFQLETAMGSAVECFAKSGAVQVPRSRFAPVKTCNDLLVLRSDVYKIEEDATVQLVRPASEVPLVKLDDAHFKLVDAMEKHIPPGSEPSLIGARSLIVKGPVKFSKGVVIQGETAVEAAAQPEALLAPGTYTGTVRVEAPAPAGAK
uniref:UTP--glucose-1-phosphate uridylyltransferase n=1 Tax=Dunaliella tertiolecta TaxID=3047 RepID=A0A7S3QLM4_DUNTE|mmetsp:Transcript_398/g.1004  ORF Transcript_398/g.1004 Transcript_398/m.1004 type:complete len:477 (+) Transcript_398:99-1529(+)|eukprot:CAMPEP_0202360594 /NCGR_PEP_ID=MMETSP1126-20121109/13476_1 /ASSEMBLY_ACC=CAM_ASM_000457 /TAXON_ID=3047 /ORGANISM="Dunaliella tertiolecta, Strain CCMP1320" /LENGTH=476 /DNA_ID=CAMNT_0048954341 /DNA_START=53 /DNA_END=1483 /DNA_ORIENTATION=-